MELIRFLSHIDSGVEHVLVTLRLPETGEIVQFERRPIEPDPQTWHPRAATSRPIRLGGTEIGWLEVHSNTLPPAGLLLAADRLIQHIHHWLRKQGTAAKAAA